MIVFLTNNKEENIKRIQSLIEYEKNNHTFFEEDQIHCNYVNCFAGMGIAGNGKCILKGNGKPDCPQFQLDITSSNE